jgi:autotransporter-associated beta strand protein
MKPASLSLSLAFALAFVASTLQAESLTWNVPNTGYWENALAWGGTRPTGTDLVTVTNPGGADNFLVVAPPSGADPTWNGTGTYGAMTINSTTTQRANVIVYSTLNGFSDATINNRAGVTVSGVGASWTSLGGIFLTGAESSLQVANGGQVSSNLAEVGNGLGATGGVSITTGGRWFNDADLNVGVNGGNGILSVDSGGMLDLDGSLVIGSGSSSSVGSVGINFTSGTQGVIQAYSVVKSIGTGTLVFDGGILRADRNEADFITGFVGSELGIGDKGAYIDSNTFNVGVSSGFVGQGGLAKQGVGTLTLTGSNSYGGNTVVQRGTLAVGVNGVINSPAATIAAGANSGENGTFTVSGGQVTAAQMFVGSNSGGTGSLTVSSGSLSISGSLSVAGSGTGSVAISGGAVTNGNSFFGSTAGTATATVSGGVWTNTGDMTFGKSTLTVTGGTVTTAGNSLLGAYSNTPSVATVSAGTWDTAGYVILGLAASGSLEVNGGTVYARSGLVIGYDTPGTGVVTLSSGTLAVPSILEQGGGAGKLNLNGGTLRVLASYGDFISGFEAGDVSVGGNARIDTNGFATGLINSIDGAGSLIKTGAGTLTLSGSNTYTGQTEVEGGTLLINGSNASNSLILVDANALLGGTGTLSNVQVNNGGTLTAGTEAGAGLLVFTGNLVMQTGSTLSLQFSGTGGGAFDQLAVGGLITATNVNLFLDVNYAAQIGDSFQVFTSARPGAGAFTITTDLGPSMSWDSSQLSSAGVLTIVAVPEPGTLSLAFLGLGVFVYTLRRKRHSRRA